MNAAVLEICRPQEDEEEGAQGGAGAGLARLLKHARDWNTNSRSSRVAQALLTGVLLAVVRFFLRLFSFFKPRTRYLLFRIRYFQGCDLRLLVATCHS